MIKTKVLLITTPCIDLYKGFRDVVSKYSPLGLAYIASYLESKSIKVEIYDSFGEDADMEDIRHKIDTTNADFIGITSVTTSIREAIEIARIAKIRGKITIIGGIHCSAMPKQTLERHIEFDYGVFGEGEISFYELVSGKNPSKINGLVYRQNSKVIMNPKRELIENISNLPHPARHLLKNEIYKAPEKYFFNNGMYFNIITSRGCPYQCTFCSSKVIWGTKVRFRTAEDVISELDSLKNMGMQELTIIDDTFTLNFKRFKKITEKIKSLNIRWGCNTRVNTLNEEIIKCLKDAGCILLEFGIESGNQDILDYMKKGTTLEQARKALRLTRRYKIKSSCSFIIGNIHETKESIKDTVNFAIELNPDFAQFNMMTPYPGTEAYNIAKKEGYLTTDIESYVNPKYSDPVLKLPNMKPQEIKEYCKKAYRKFYLRPRYVFRIVFNSLFSINEFKRNFKFFRSFLRLR